MSRRDDLMKLRDAVQSGDIGVTGPGGFRAIPKRGVGVYSDQNWYDAGSAYWQGSLDAARDLHEALLPEWGCVLNTYRQWVRIWDQSSDDCPEHEAVSVHSVARAWLIAILDALIAQEPDT